MLSRRKNTIEYFLPSDSAKIQVCKKTFLKTLDIGERTIAYTLKKRRPHSNSDNRGKQCPTTNILESEKEIIRQHIRSFPVIESHYCRKTSQRKYLEKDPSIRKMYDLYCNELKNKGEKCQKFLLYDAIFGTEFNIGFHTPKKDVCQFCDRYSKLQPHEKEKQKEEYKEHQSRKVQAKEKKVRRQVKITQRSFNQNCKFRFTEGLDNAKIKC